MAERTDLTERIKRGPGAGAPWRRYLAAAVFFAVFSSIYNRFSHEIRSPWMTFLCLWPLLCGCVPAVLMEKGILPHPLRFEYSARSELPEGVVGKETANTPGAMDSLRTDIYHFGVAALTAASLLKGILEIAGTDSVYTDVLLFAGLVMLAAGIFFYLRELGRIRKQKQE